METESVTVVFTNRTTMEVSQETAWTMCGTPDIATRIVDVLTDNTALQARYRARMDNLED